MLTLIIRYTGGVGSHIGNGCIGWSIRILHMEMSFVNEFRQLRTQLTKHVDETQLTRPETGPASPIRPARVRCVEV